MTPYGKSIFITINRAIPMGKYWFKVNSEDIRSDLFKILSKYDLKYAFA